MISAEAKAAIRDIQESVGATVGPKIKATVGATVASIVISVPVFSREGFPEKDFKGGYSDSVLAALIELSHVS